MVSVILNLEVLSKNVMYHPYFEQCFQVYVRNDLHINFKLNTSIFVNTMQVYRQEFFGDSLFADTRIQVQFMYI